MFRRVACLTVLTLVVELIGGCQVTPNMFKDDFAGQPPVTTPSVEAVHAANPPPATVEPQGEPKSLPFVDGAVTHLPLYFEDPFEDAGSEDGKFAWTGEDYLWIAYWRARFLINAVAFPVSAVVNPPWQITVSDGVPEPRVLGEKLDAARWTPPSDTAPPPAQPTGGS